MPSEQGNEGATMKVDPPVRLPSRRDHLEHFGFKISVGLLRALSPSLALRLGAAVGSIAYLVDRRDRAIALRNLRIALPDKSEAEHRRILRASCRNLGRVGAEICHMHKLTPATLHRYVGFASRTVWEAAMRDMSERGGVISTGHFGNWELFAYANGLLGYPVTIIHRRMRNPLVDAAIADLRSGAGTKLIPKREAAREAIRTLRQKGMVVIAIDQNQVASQGVFVDFFGKPACTTTGPARLALRTGSPVYSAFLIREGESERHRIEMLPPREPIHTGDREADVIANTQVYTRELEDMIRHYPEQWIWFHRRWRTRPPGEAQFY